MTGRQRARVWPVVAILLLATALRWRGLGPMEVMLHYDEAYNGWDTLELMAAPRLTPFLETNHGRESGWHYFLLPFLAAAGPRPLALHLAAGMAGILTVAAMYRLGQDLFGHLEGQYAALGLAVLYWHVHLSHLGLRAITQPLLGALGFALLWRAQRRTRWPPWVVAGACLGLLAYTYFSARLWLLLAAGILAWRLMAHPRQRRQVLLAGTVMALVSLPQLLYGLGQPATALGRIDEVAVLALDQVWHNARLWVEAWWRQGDTNPALNLAGRPILDPVQGLLLAAGGVSLVVQRRRRTQLLWIAGLAAAAVAPSLFSDRAPHFLRAIGLVVPTALLCGHGAAALARPGPTWPARLTRLLLPALWLLSATITARDFDRWLQQEPVSVAMETFINAPARWLGATTPAQPDISVYFTPSRPDYATVAFQRAALAPRAVTGFDPAKCLVLAPPPAYYVDVLGYGAPLPDRMAPWATLAPIATTGRPASGRPLYTIYTLDRTRLDLWSAAASHAAAAAWFADALRVSPVSLREERRAGATVPVWLALSAARSVPGSPSLFLHLHGAPSPYEGGPIWAQQDRPLCPSYPPSHWRPAERILQMFPLQLPPDLPPGTYELAVGLYYPQEGLRLPLTAPAPHPDNYYIIGPLQITD